MNRNPPTEVPDQKDQTEDLPAKKTRPPATPDRSPLQDDQTDTSPELAGTKKAGTLVRGRPKLIRSQEQSTSPEKRPGNGENKQLGPLTIDTDQMSDSDIEQIMSDTQQSGQDLIRDINSKVFYNTFEQGNESDSEVVSNLSSSTDIENEIENIEETNLRRTKRLTHINPIV